MTEADHILTGRRRRSHFRFLLVAIGLMFVLRPLLEGFAGIGFLTDLFLSLILLAGAYAFSDQGKMLVLLLMIVLPALVLDVISYFRSSEAVQVSKAIFTAVFLACVLAVILSKILVEKEVTEDLITGAVCAYFLAGMLWAFVFYFLALAKEGSFTNMSAAGHDLMPFVYFSFVTIASLGYGDIVPVTGPARSLAVLEAVTGQLFLAITIARLVGVHASQFRFKERT